MQLEGQTSKLSEGMRAVPAARWKAKKESIDLTLVKGSGPQGVILSKDIEQFRVTQGALDVTLMHDQNCMEPYLPDLPPELLGIPS